MIIRIFKLFIFYGLLYNMSACSTFQTIETNTQGRLNVPKDQLDLDKFLLNCELLSIRINPFEEETFPLRNNDSSSNSTTSSTLNFNNGKCSGFGVCNSIYGKYTIEGNAINFTNISSTYKNCIGNYGFAEPRSGNEIENLIKSTLGQINNFTIKHNELILKKDSNVLMRYRIK